MSKIVLIGEYLIVGSFMVRGKKNFFFFNFFVMGFGVLFRFEDNSIVVYLNER